MPARLAGKPEGSWQCSIFSNALSQSVPPAAGMRASITRRCAKPEKLIKLIDALSRRER